MTQDQIPNTHKTSIQLPYPSGVTRLFMRFPIWLYRLKLGWLLGKRFLHLEHRGRKSGLIRHAVVEIVDHDVQNDSYVVASAWGHQSDWYRNITVEPHVKIGIGTKRFPAIAKTLSPDDAAQHLMQYATEHPYAFRQFSSFMIGSKSRDTMQIIKTFTEAMPFVEFIPIKENTIANE